MPTAGGGAPSLGQRNIATCVAITVVLAGKYGQNSAPLVVGMWASGKLKLSALNRLACSRKGAICASTDQRYCDGDEFGSTPW